MIELAAHQPAVGDLWFRNGRNQFAARFNFVAIGAARIERAVVQRFFCAAEENLLFQIFSAQLFRAQILQLRLHEILHRSLFGHAFSAGEISVLNFQTAQESADSFGISVRQLQFRIAPVELERVTFTAICLEGNFLVERAGSVGFVATRTIQFAAALRVNRVAEVQSVIEFERVGIFQMVRVNLELGMIFCERTENFGVTRFRPRRFKKDLSLRGIEAKIEIFGGNFFPFGERRLHHFATGMARVAILAVRRRHRAAALMFQMARGAGQIFCDVWLMKIMLRVTTQTRFVNARH